MPSRHETRSFQAALSLVPLEDRSVPASAVYAVAPDAGGGPIVRVLEGAGREVAAFLAYESSFTGGVHVAMGDVTDDGVQDVITGAGVGGAPLVRVFDGTDFSLVGQFFAYESTFRGGVQVATGNFDADPAAEIVVGAGRGGGPLVRVFQFARGGVSVAAEFFAYEPGFRGGVRIAAGNVDGIPGDEIVTGAGDGGAPAVRVFARDGTPRISFFAYEPGFRGGVEVAVGDLTGDGFAEVVTGPGLGGGPLVRVFDGQIGGLAEGFFAYDPSFRGGVRVAIADVTGDGRLDVVTGAGPGGGPDVRAFDGRTTALLRSDFAFDPSFRGGLAVAGRLFEAQGVVAGWFENPRPENPDVLVSITENVISWGEAANSADGGHSSMILHPSRFSASLHDIIPVGTLSYVNKATKVGTVVDTVDLILTVHLAGTADEDTVGIRLPLRIDTTPNTDSRDASADTVYLPGEIAPRLVRFPDGTFKLMRFYGFAHNDEDVFSNRVTRFTVAEGEAGVVSLYASFTDALSSDFEIRQVGSLSGGVPGTLIKRFGAIANSLGFLAVDYIPLEIRDRTTGVTAWYSYYGAGVGKSVSPFSLTTAGSWAAFHISAPVSVTDFGGPATLASTGGGQTSTTTLIMDGTPAGVDHVTVPLSGFTFGLGVSVTVGVLRFEGLDDPSSTLP